MRTSAITKIKALRDYWNEKGDAAYRAGNRAAYTEANSQLGSLLLPIERLSGTFYWYSGSPWREAIREWGGPDYPPRYQRKSEQWVADRAAAMQQNWRLEHGVG